MLRGAFITMASVLLALVSSGEAQADTNPPLGRSFFEDFDRFDHRRWFIADGYTNGEWVNCTWSKRNLALFNGALRMIFNKRPSKERDYSCAEIKSYEMFRYGTYETRIKTEAGTGLNAAFFTYIGPFHGVPHDEIDFEILLKDTSKVSINTYVAGESLNGTEVDLVVPTDEDFSVYSFVWEPDRIRWYVNGTLVHETEEGTPVPSNSAQITLSIWGSNTFPEWMGPFEDPGGPRVADFDWVAYTAPGDPCQTPDSIVCLLDQ